ncbi:MAG: hypothetical protein JXO51_07485 [Candidatus Aminicenantes bacterium]|nr:hypothetical protein [Candidatus Aminicenantes bacterium]
MGHNVETPGTKILLKAIDELTDRRYKALAEAKQCEEEITALQADINRLKEHSPTTAINASWKDAAYNLLTKPMRRKELNELLEKEGRPAPSASLGRWLSESVDEEMLVRLDRGLYIRADHAEEYDT